MAPLVLLLAMAAANVDMVMAKYSPPQWHEETFTVPFELGPGEIYNEFVEMVMPQGRIAIEAFNADITDQPTTAPCCNTEESVPLTDVYLHHWTVNVFNITPEITEAGSIMQPSGSVGPCDRSVYHQIFGVGSEARNTNTSLPYPYALVIELQENQKWITNIHAIDTRSVRDVRGCIECNCEELGVDTSQFPEHMKGYIGGLECCHSTKHQGAKCPVQDGLDVTNMKKIYYLRYTVRWRPVDECTIPVNVMVLDVTDEDGSFWTHQNMGMGCMIEYSLRSCDPHKGSLSECMAAMSTKWEVPYDMDLIFMYGHQHFAGLGVTLFRDNDPVRGRICDSLPMYGHGHGASTVGKERGYVTGMTTCEFKDGFRLKKGESLSMTSTYMLDSRPHTGVMGLWWVAFVNQTREDEIVRPAYCSPRSKMDAMVLDNPFVYMMNWIHYMLFGSTQ